MCIFDVRGEHKIFRETSIINCFVYRYCWVFIIREGELFSITIYKEVIGDMDRREYIYLNTDGTFTHKLPKYILKGVQPLVDMAMKDKRFVKD